MSDEETVPIEDNKSPRKEKEHKKKEKSHNKEHKEHKEHKDHKEHKEHKEHREDGRKSPDKGLSKSKDKHLRSSGKKKSTSPNQKLKKSSHDKGKEKEGDEEHEHKDKDKDHKQNGESTKKVENFTNVDIGEDYSEARSHFEEKGDEHPSDEDYKAIDTDEGRKKLVFENVFSHKQWLTKWNALKNDEKLPEVDFAVPDKPKEEGHEGGGEKPKGPSEEQLLETAKSQSKLCQMRKIIDLGTWEAIESGSYTLEDKETVSLRKTKKSSESKSNFRPTYFNNDHKFPPITYHEDCLIHVVEEDAISTAIWMKYNSKEGYNPLVLNMCHKSKFGGGYKDGTRGFEEELWRRSNIRQFFKEPSSVVPEFGGIHVPDVTVFRSSEETGYEFLAEPKTVSFFNSYSYYSPKLIEVLHGKEQKPTGKFEIDPNVAKHIKRKMRTVLLAGLELGYNAIILSAWGCGKNKSSPSEMARLWQEVILEDFKDKEGVEGAYKKIVFAIKEGAEGRMDHNPEGNFEPFQHLWKEGKPEMTIKCIVM
eukprot:TRINITY_DN2316_c0_g1_i1.p1 TRINITY_DN2316_c0_g1~~TRINITY_DN2316_c0_g1_i1.p1  ORF type:complete len:534 (-),score=143.30 TRINITY_DN2316_c0_g1_i1:42-1643(-)